MGTRELSSRPSEPPAIPVGRLATYAQSWVLDCRARRLSPQTIYTRSFLLDKLLWFLRDQELEECGRPEIRAFLAYVNSGHEDPRGRWANPRERRPVKPRTTVSYYIILATFCSWCVEERILDSSPMAGMKPPVARDDQVSPFTPDQAEALKVAASRSRYRGRDLALFLFLIDTGARASEVCNLKVKDVDTSGHRAVVRGKGDKLRALIFGRETARALWAYLRERGEEPEPDQPFFLAVGGRHSHGALTRSGLLRFMRELGKAAGVEAVRCSPHTCRHYFALEFLRDGGDVFSLKELLGHESLVMVNRYLQLAKADIEAQGRAHSPADRLKRRKAG